MRLSATDLRNANYGDHQGTHVARRLHTPALPPCVQTTIGRQQFEATYSAIQAGKLRREPDRRPELLLVLPSALILAAWLTDVSVNLVLRPTDAETAVSNLHWTLLLWVVFLIMSAVGSYLILDFVSTHIRLGIQRSFFGIRYRRACAAIRRRRSRLDSQLRDLRMRDAFAMATSVATSISHGATGGSGLRAVVSRSDTSGLVMIELDLYEWVADQPYHSDFANIRWSMRAGFRSQVHYRLVCTRQWRIAVSDQFGERQMTALRKHARASRKPRRGSRVGHEATRPTSPSPSDLVERREQVWAQGKVWYAPVTHLLVLSPTSQVDEAELRSLGVAQVAPTNLRAMLCGAGVWLEIARAPRYGSRRVLTRFAEALCAESSEIAESRLALRSWPQNGFDERLG